MGVTFALLLGEIDLSIGFVSGVGGVLTAILLTPDGNELPTFVVFVIVLGAGLAIGTLHGLIITKVGVPSFVVTLAGLLAWNGVVLLLIGSRGTVILQNDFVIGLANDFLSPARRGSSPRSASACTPASSSARSACAGAPGSRSTRRSIIALRDHRPRRRARGRRRSSQPGPRPAVRGAGRRRRPVLVLSYMLNRTKFGRHIYAVGGNAEAARRAGINVDNVRIACFALCSLMAVIGGIILASRLRSVDTNTGGGQALLYPIAAAVIGGTSLFGGRGTMKAAHPRRARDALDRQRARPARPVLGHEVRAHGRRAAAGRDGRLDLAPGSRPERQGMTERLRVGILSTAKINDAILEGARASAGAEVVAVASRDRGRAEAYAAEKGIPRVHGSYEDLLADETSRPSTSRCPTRCTCRGRSRRWRPASTCCARSRCRAGRRTSRRRSTPPSAPGGS